MIYHLLSMNNLMIKENKKSFKEQAIAVYVMKCVVYNTVVVLTILQCSKLCMYLENIHTLICTYIC